MLGIHNNQLLTRDTVPLLDEIATYCMLVHDGLITVRW